MREIVKAAAGWIHAVLILASIIPAIYMLGNNRNAVIENGLYLKCLVIAIPVVITGIAIVRCKSMLQYLTVSVLTTGLTALCAYLLVRSVQYGSIRLGYIIIILAETAVVIVDRLLGRLNKKDKTKVYEVSSPFQKPEYDFLLKPKFFTLILFFIEYFLAKNFASKSVCDIAFGSAVAYFFVAMLYQYIDKTEKYLKLNKGVCNLPSRRIFSISGNMFAAVMVVFVILVIPSIAASGHRTYNDVRENLAERNISFEALFEDNRQQSGGESYGGEEQLMEVYEIKEPPKWLNYLMYGLVIAVITVLFIALLKAVIASSKEFREVYDVNGDLVENLDEVQKIKQPRQKKRDSEPDSEREKIRKQYRMTIRKYRKEKPYPYETPSEIEKNAGIANEEDVIGLHATYEKVRYGREEK